MEAVTITLATNNIQMWHILSHIRMLVANNNQHSNNRKSRINHHHLRSLLHPPLIVLAEGMATMSNSNAALISTAVPMVGFFKR
jgi:hypothetical protein